MPSPLPDDINALKAMVLAQQASMEQMALALASGALEVEQLKLLIAKLQRMQFGRKSEKIDRQIEKLECRLEDLLAEEGTIDAQAPSAVPTIQRTPSTRQPLPPDWRAKTVFLTRPTKPALTAAATSKRLVKMSPSNLKSSIPRSRSFATFGAKKPARAVTASCKCRLRAARSCVAWPAPVCWPILWYRNLPIINRCIGSR